MESIGSAGENRASNNVWRCDNHIVSEAKLNAAVERALALLPGEIDNIKAIQARCREIILNSSSAGRVDNRRGAEPEAPTELGDTVASAQLLLLHTDTALRYLEGGGGDAGTRREPSTAAIAACKTLDSFIKRTLMEGLTATGELGELDPVELLIDKVVIDGDEIKVQFKAGVEI